MARPRSPPKRVSGAGTCFQLDRFEDALAELERVPPLTDDAYLIYLSHFLRGRTLDVRARRGYDAGPGTTYPSRSTVIGSTR